MVSGKFGTVINCIDGRTQAPVSDWIKENHSVDYVAEYNRTDTIVTIVDDSKIYPVIEAIINAASTGSKGDGKIFVSPIEESFDIGTKEMKQLTA